MTAAGAQRSNGARRIGANRAQIDANRAQIGANRTQIGANRVQICAKRGRIEGRLLDRKDTFEAGDGGAALGSMAAQGVLGVAQALFG